MSVQIKCPICESPTSLFDVVDFNKSCGDPTARATGLAGIPVYYNQCSGCDFLFAPEIHAWAEKDFLEKIYNDEYVKFDGDYLEKRPLNNVAKVEQIFGQQKSIIRHLDYGGGNGMTSGLLRDAGWNSFSYDPFPRSDISLDSFGRFNLITAFEVFEHVPNIRQLMTNLLALLEQNGLALVSTLLSDGQIQQAERLNWWYAAPRNGHISLFSKCSMELLAQRYGLKVRHLNQKLHVFQYDLTDTTT